VQTQLIDQPRVSIRRVHAVVNPASGGVGAGAADELAALLAELGLDQHVSELVPGRIEQTVQGAVDAGPDLIVVLGGDGTARLVAEMCGPEGPLVAPLSGGTMSKLGRALYGPIPWREALRGALTRGEARWVSGGEVGGRAFYCSAVLGTPARWARAREAVRARRLGRAWRWAVAASRTASLARLSYQFNGDVGRGLAIGLICPAISRALGDDERVLETAVLDLRGARAGVRLALNNLPSRPTGRHPLPCPRLPRLGPGAGCRRRDRHRRKPPARFRTWREGAGSAAPGELAMIPDSKGWRVAAGRLAPGLAMIALVALGAGVPPVQAQPLPEYDDPPPPAPPEGYGPSDQRFDAQAAQLRADEDYRRAVERWSVADCVRERNNNVASGAVIGGACSARSPAGRWAVAGGALGALAGASVGASTTSPGCPPGFVVRPGAPAFVNSGFGPGWVYTAPPDYRPWVLVNGRWAYRPYPYHRYWRRRYWR
jgi:hypothetical protein